MIVNFGSLNIDHVYRVPHFVRPGETLNSAAYQRFCGGKGFNQSVALLKAGADAIHVGRVGPDGGDFLAVFDSLGAESSAVEKLEQPGGHAIIQVDTQGENCILLHGGANRSFTSADVERLLQPFGAGDWLLVQNETSAIPEAIGLAAAKGMKVAANPAPMGKEVLDWPLQSLDLLVVNEIEASELSGATEVAEIFKALAQKCPQALIVLTLGAEGVVARDRNGKQVRSAATKVEVVDTTAAGDTFLGYFMAAWVKGGDLEVCLERACRAAALAVSRAGASDSIPLASELD